MLILASPFVQSIIALFGVLVAIAALLATIVMYRRGKNKKEICCSLVSIAPIVSVDPSVAYRVKISLDGGEVREAQLAVFSVRNTGNVAVKREDYDEPITIEFPHRKILQGEVIDTTPKGLLKIEDRKTFLTCDGACATLGKHLLNPKEEIQLSILFEGREVQPETRARIVDGTLVEGKRFQQPKHKHLTPFSIGVVITMSGFILCLLTTIHINTEVPASLQKYLNGEPIDTVLFVVALILLLLGIPILIIQELRENKDITREIKEAEKKREEALREIEESERRREEMARKVMKEEAGDIKWASKDLK